MGTEGDFSVQLVTIIIIHHRSSPPDSHFQRCCRYAHARMSHTLRHMLKTPDVQIQSLLCSGVATPGPTRAQALVELVCALVKLLNSQA